MKEVHVENEQKKAERDILIQQLNVLSQQLCVYQKDHPNDSADGVRVCIRTANKTASYITKMVALFDNKELGSAKKKAQAIKLYQDYTDATLYQFWNPGVDFAWGVGLVAGCGTAVGGMLGIGAYCDYMIGAGASIHSPLVVTAVIGLTLAIIPAAMLAFIVGKSVATVATKAITGKNFLGTRRERAWKPPVDEAAASSSADSPAEDQKGCLDQATDAVASIADLGCQFFNVTPKPSYFARFRPQCLGGAPDDGYSRVVTVE